MVNSLVNRSKNIKSSAGNARLLLVIINGRSNCKTANPWNPSHPLSPPCRSHSTSKPTNANASINIDDEDNKRRIIIMVYYYYSRDRRIKAMNEWMNTLLKKKQVLFKSFYRNSCSGFLILSSQSQCGWKFNLLCGK